MGWERTSAGMTGLTLDQLRFALSFFLAVPFAWGLRQIHSPSLRHVYAIISGFLLTCYPFGAQAMLHLIPCSALTYLAMAVAPKNCGKVAWAVCFPYLVALHTISSSGEEWKKGNTDITGRYSSLFYGVVLTRMPVSRRPNVRDPLLGRRPPVPANHRVRCSYLGFSLKCAVRGTFGLPCVTSAP